MSVCPCNGNVVEQQGRAALGLTAAGCSLRSVLAGLAAMLTLSGCGTFLNPVPVNPPAASAGPPVPSPAPVVCQLHETIAQLVYLQGLGVEEQRREHLAAQQAFLADPSEANRLRLILTLSLPRYAWRDDMRVQRLIDALDAVVPETGCTAGLASALLRLSSDRLRVLREEQRRHDVLIRDEQRNHELALRDELRRSDMQLRDERQRYLELKQKLDALIEIDRRMRRDPHGVRR